MAASGDEALDELHDPEMDEIVPGGKDHQRQHQRQADAEAVFLGALAQRLTADRLGGIKQQMTPVKHRHREQIDQPEIDRQDRHEPEQRDDAALSNLARHLRDAQRPAELVAGTGADDDLPHRLERRARQVPGLADRAQHRAGGIAPDILDAAAPDAEQADLVAIAQAVGDLGAGRRHVQRDRLAVAPDDNRHRHARIEAYDLLHVLEALDVAAVDADDQIAGMDAARLGRAAGLHLADFGRGEGLAIGHEQQGQHDNRKHEIGDRTAGDDRGALAKPLAVEGHRPFGRTELAQPGDRQAGAGIGVAEHLDVAAERDRAELPAGAGPVPPAEQLRPEADREDLDLDPVAARDQIMAELVNKDEDRQHQQKKADVTNT